jgi:hypothetical protein
MVEKNESVKKIDFDSSDDSQYTVWAENELALFQWTVIVIGLISETHPKDFVKAFLFRKNPNSNYSVKFSKTRNIISFNTN